MCQAPVPVYIHAAIRAYTGTHGLIPWELEAIIE